MATIGEGFRVFLLPPPPSPSLCLYLTAVVLTLGLGQGYDCGGYVRLSATSIGSLQSPGYPGNYPNYTRCIWILEAPAQHVASLTVNFHGETFNGACADFVQFRDGGQTGDVILTSCGTMTSQVVTSTSRWMYVYFESDGLSQVDGLSATFTALYRGSSVNSNITNPLVDCRSYEYECSNRLCISRSYRCDGFYDCGCGQGCDEDGCQGLPIDKAARLGVGLAVGVTVFVLVAALGLLLERRHNWEREKIGERDREMEDSRRIVFTSLKDNRVDVMDRPPSALTPPSPLTPPCTIRVSQAD